MINFDDEYFLALAINTPLPESDNADLEVSFNCVLAAPRRSSPRPSLMVEIPAPSTPVVKRTLFAAKGTPSSQSKGRKKRKAEFAIFMDPEEQLPTPFTATPKRPKMSTPRTPLADRGSSTPVSSPRPLDTTFSFSSEDPNWENWENYIPWHQRPQFDAPHSSPLNPTTPSAGTPPPSQSPPPPSHDRRPARPRRNNPLVTPPVDMTLYNMLDLVDWHAAAEVIHSAYRHKARTIHPDHASTPEERLVATEAMQRLNAAKEVLLDNRARTIYHRTGVLPWAV
ncbi:hypothetical protein yc1106_06719 [Curvularia clavata]|uniref:J domain-containing protein n=1 Tax=Curvularia clavata TaxID=95742 RepID=A0A9Q8ZCZ0_CURCL|nr:hypothetical protein yc1106_06719 [Curvularia clavata]